MSARGTAETPAAPATPDAVATPLRVLVGVHDGMVSGINTYIENVAAAAATAAGRVTLLVADDTLAGDVGARLAGTGVQVVSLAITPPTSTEAVRVRLSPSFAARRLRSGVLRALPRIGNDYDVVHLNHPHLASVMRPAARRVSVAAWFYPHSLRGRVVSTWEHSGARFPRSAALAVKGAMHYRNDSRGYRDADLVIAPTHVLATQLRRLGLAAEQCWPPARVLGDAEAAGRLQPSHAPRLLICCGDLAHPRKNVALALDAVRLLAGGGLKLELDLVGGNADALNPQLERLPASVSLTRSGPVAAAAVHARMEVADALLLPSRFEEWGYVAVEAALHGAPTVALPVYPFEEMLTPPLGVRAAGATPAEYAAAIDEMLHTARDRDTVRSSAEQRFGLASVGRALAALWTQPDAAEAASRDAHAPSSEPRQPMADGRMSQ